MITIPFIKLHPDAHIPTKAHPQDAGWDIRCIADQLSEGVIMPVKTGIAMNIPSGWCGVIKGRSGIALRHGVTVAGGLIDAGYLGEIVVILHCHSSYGYGVERGDRIAQIVFLPVPEVSFIEVDSLEDTARGEKGFGSTDAPDKYEAWPKYVFP